MSDIRWAMRHHPLATGFILLALSPAILALVVLLVVFAVVALTVEALAGR